MKWKKTVRALSAVLLMSGAAFLLLYYSADVAAGAFEGLQNAAVLLVPSLLPFMVFASFLMRSGISAGFGRLLTPLTRHYFRVPDEAGAAIVLSFVGGFPVGARCVRLLYDQGQITAVQAEQMMLYCVCSGPAFLITGVGTLLLHNTRAGALLYAAQIIAGLILARLSAHMYRTSQSVPNGKLSRQRGRAGLTEAFVLSCRDGSEALLSLSAMVTLFAAVLRLCESTGLRQLIFTVLRSFLGAEFPVADNALPVLLEVTAACRHIAEGGCPLWLLSFAVGFGGLCVHCQILAILGDLPLHKGRFFCFRLMNAFLSAVIVYTIGLFEAPAVSAAALPGGLNAECSAATGAGAIALMVMSTLFVLSLHRERKRTGLQGGVLCAGSQAGLIKAWISGRKQRC